MCLGASKTSKMCLFGATSCKANFENYSRYSLIKWFQFLYSMSMSNTVLYRYIIQHEQYYLITLLMDLRNNFFIEYIWVTAFGLSFVNPGKKSVKELV